MEASGAAAGGLASPPPPSPAPLEKAGACAVHGRGSGSAWAAGEAPGSQPNLNGLAEYEQPPFVDFAAVGPQTDLAQLNLSWRERDLPERERTKHVHRLHPYLGKFVPQLVEIFLRKYQPRRVLDPFMGSGTTLVEAAALGLEAWGVDVSAFNCLVAAVKTAKHDLTLLPASAYAALAHAEQEARDVADNDSVPAAESETYLETWYAPAARRALVAYREAMGGVPQPERAALSVILSRAARSARQTTHFELDFPAVPAKEPYWCRKHRRMCLPTADALGFLRRYTADTLARLAAFAALRNASRAPWALPSGEPVVRTLWGDVREVALPERYFDLAMTSPPYVGLIDYHEQHRYAYELLGLPRRDAAELGPAAAGNGRAATERYVRGMEEALARVRDALVPGGRLVVVVADRKQLYDGVAERLGMERELRLRRHVNRRTGRRAGEFYEDILVWRTRSA